MFGTFKSPPYEPTPTRSPVCRLRRRPCLATPSPSAATLLNCRGRLSDTLAFRQRPCVTAPDRAGGGFSGGAEKPLSTASPPPATVVAFNGLTVTGAGEGLSDFEA
jgi:hypothetical protein